MKKITSALLALGLILGLGLLFSNPASATGGGSEDNDKRWVCKYVGTPGEDERLKDGKNPISVDSSATAGTWFNDAQGRSFVLAVQTPENTGEGNTYTGDLTCPPGDDGEESPTPTPTPTETSATPTPTESENDTPTPTPSETDVTITPSPSESTATPSSTPSSTPTNDDPELPKTGAPAPLLAGLGSLLAALGAGALWLTRKPGLHE
jgi:LPXTG-motif cell wall-anchored protein